MLDGCATGTNPADAAVATRVLYLMVALRGADPTALTAAYAMRHRLGLDASIADLARMQFWRFELEASSDARAVEEASSWVTQSQLFVNPNQHTHELVAADAAAARRPAPAHEPWIVIRNEPDLDGEAATRLVRERLGGLSLVTAQKAVIWKLGLDPTLSAERCLELAEQVAVAQERSRGLLGNPHYQTVHVIPETSPGAAGNLLWGEG